MYLNGVNNKLIEEHSTRSASLYKEKMTGPVTLSNKFIGRRHRFFKKNCESKIANHFFDHQSGEI